MLTYEKLAGATGARIFYKPERFAARDLFKGRLPALSVGDTAGVLEEVGMTELVAFTRTSGSAGGLEGRRLSVRLTVDGELLEEVDAEITNVDQSGLGQRLTLQIARGYIDVRTLVARHRQLLIRAEMTTALDRSPGVSPEYRLLCIETIDLLRQLEAAFGRFEAINPTAEAKAEMFALAEDKVVPRWRELWQRANAVVAPIMGDAAALASTKGFTERVLTPHFMAGPIWRRSFEKPLGYPGDFQIMNMLYDWQREGASFYDKLIHRLGLETAQCVVTRAQIVRRAIAEIVTSEGGPVRIASLGSGPAREVCDFLTSYRPSLRPTTFTIIDQDAAALASVYERSLPAILRSEGRASIDCLNASFVQLMKAGELFGRLPPQHLIYSVGLFDYLSERRCRSLIDSLYRHLEPGGRLIIGNMNDVPTNCLWPMEFITDWSIIYRTERQMLDLASRIDAQSVHTELDSTGQVVMLHIQKP